MEHASFHTSYFVNFVLKLIKSQYLWYTYVQSIQILIAKGIKFQNAYSYLSTGIIYI
jgi:hypothetical protein